jgi:tRNA-2-methylthio-N6-dimethylallyladenosine synthase
MPDQVAADVVGERYDHVTQSSTGDLFVCKPRRRLVQHHKVLVGDYEGRRDEAQERLTGRSEDFRLDSL